MKGSEKVETKSTRREHEIENNPENDKAIFVFDPDFQSADHLQIHPVWNGHREIIF